MVKMTKVHILYVEKVFIRWLKAWKVVQNFVSELTSGPLFIILV